MKPTLTRSAAVGASALMLYIAAEILSETELFALAGGGWGDRLPKLMRYAAYLVLFAACFLNRTLSRRSLIAAGSLLLAGFAAAFLGEGRIALFFFYMVVVTGLLLPPRVILASYLMTQGVMLVLIVGGSLTGVLHDTVFLNAGRIRHGLGFSWTTTGAILYLYFLFTLVYFFRRRLKAWHYLVLFGGQIFFYYMTRTRFAFVVGVLFLLAAPFEDRFVINSNTRRSIGVVAVPMPAILCVGAIAIHMVYSSSSAVLSTLNRLLSNRLILGHDAIAEYGFHLLGSNITWHGFSVKTPTLADMPVYNYVDCSYLRLALDWGLVPVAIIVVIWSVLIYRALTSQDMMLLLVLLFIILFALTEPRLANLMYNPWPLLLFAGDPEPEGERPDTRRRITGGYQ